MTWLCMMTAGVLHFKWAFVFFAVLYTYLSFKGIVLVVHIFRRKNDKLESKHPPK